MRFNDIIREAMKKSGTTQTLLGDYLGIRQNAVSNTINRDSITLNKFITIMDALGFDIIVQSRFNLVPPMVLTNDEEVSP